MKILNQETSSVIKVIKCNFEFWQKLPLNGHQFFHKIDLILTTLVISYTIKKNKICHAMNWSMMNDALSKVIETFAIGSGSEQ